MKQEIREEQLDSVDFQRNLMREIIHSQRLRCLAMAGIYLFISLMFIFFGLKQKLPMALLAENWGLPNYAWIVVFNAIVGIYEFVNFLLLKSENQNSTYSKLFPYTTSFLEAIHPTCIIWLLSHTLPVSVSLQAPPVFLYGMVIILSALHINPRLCIFTGAVAGVSYTGLALVLSHTHSLTESAFIIKAVYFVITGAVAALVTNEIKKSLVRSGSMAIQKDEADAASFAKSKFLAAASHDLRQPLHALSLFTGVLDKRLKDEGERAILQNITSSVVALEKLLNSLLDISSLDAGIVQSDVKDFKIAIILNRLAAEYAPQAENKGLGLLYEPCDFTVRSDPVLLETMLRNLINNAIRYTKTGEVAIECRIQHQKVSIDIIDTGVGISPEQQEIIFQEFQQLNNPEHDRNKGLGLGLAIVDRLSRLMNHTIKVVSERGVGSHFIITLPLGDASSTAYEGLNERPDYEINLPDFLILVIDDESMIREGMKALLNEWGYDAILAASETEAINELKAKGQCPDVIIADLRLREGMTGIQAIKHIRSEFESDVPAVVISGDTAPEKLLEVHDSGLVMLHKPVQPAKLHAFINLMVIKKKAREPLIKSG